MLAAMAAPLLWLGVYPQPILNAVAARASPRLQQRAVRTPAARAGRHGGRPGRRRCAAGDRASPVAPRPPPALEAPR